MLERYFREKLVESEEFTRIGGWWDRKGGNEIDIIAADDFNESLEFIEVKRNPERYKSKVLDEKVVNFFRANSSLRSFTYTARCLSLEDM